MKRILISCIIIIVLLPVLFVPAFASEIYMFYPSTPPMALSDDIPITQSGIVWFYQGILPDGSYTISFVYSGHAIAVTISDFIGDSNVYSSEPFTIPDDGRIVSVNMQLIPGQNWTKISFVDTAGSTAYFGGVSDFAIRAIPVEIANFPVAVTEGLTSVIRWCAMVATALISGGLSPLLPLFAIAISISVLLLAYKIIKKHSWGV